MAAHILVVEDDRALRTVLVGALQSGGFEAVRQHLNLLARVTVADKHLFLEGREGNDAIGTLNYAAQMNVPLTNRIYVAPETRQTFIEQRGTQA